jgi:hypothetical protein
MGVVNSAHIQLRVEQLAQSVDQNIKLTRCPGGSNCGTDQFL